MQLSGYFGFIFSYHFVTQSRNRYFLNYEPRSRHLPQPMTFGDCSVATDRVVLVSYPHDEDYVKCSCGVVKELRHDRLHACRQGKDKIIHAIETKLFSKNFLLGLKA